MVENYGKSDDFISRSDHEVEVESRKWVEIPQENLLVIYRAVADWKIIRLFSPKTTGFFFEFLPPNFKKKKRNTNHPSKKDRKIPWVKVTFPESKISAVRTFHPFGET